MTFRPSDLKKPNWPVLGARSASSFSRLVPALLAATSFGCSAEPAADRPAVVDVVAPPAAAAKASPERAPRIEGLSPGAVLAAYRERGFETEDNSSDSVFTWRAERKADDHSRLVEFYGPDPDSVGVFEAVVNNHGDADVDELGSEFLASAAGLAAGEESAAAAEWVRANGGRATETELGSVRVRLMGTGNGFRAVRVEGLPKSDKAAPGAATAATP